MEVINYLRNLRVNYPCKLRKLQTMPIPDQNSSYDFSFLKKNKIFGVFQLIL